MTDQEKIELKKHVLLSIFNADVERGQVEEQMLDEIGLNGVLEFYEEGEEYEKCALIKKVFTNKN